MQISSPGLAPPSMITQLVEAFVGMYAETVAAAPLMHTASGSTLAREYVVAEPGGAGGAGPGAGPGGLGDGGVGVGGVGGGAVESSEELRRCAAPWHGSTRKASELAAGPLACRLTFQRPA